MSKLRHVPGICFADDRCRVSCSVFNDGISSMSNEHPVRSVCVYCGSRFGTNPAHKAAAEALGTALAKADMGLVYGGGSVGLMGVVARSCVDAGGRVIGIIPEHLDRIEVTQDGLDELIITHNMHDRKHKMFDRSDAFVILPGGLGTLDETFEVLTWAQLHLHSKPIILLDSDGYWRKLIDVLHDIVREGFASADNVSLLHHTTSVDETMAFLRAARVDNSNVDSSLL